MNYYRDTHICRYPKFTKRQTSINEENYHREYLGNSLEGYKMKIIKSEICKIHFHIYRNVIFCWNSNKAPVDNINCTPKLIINKSVFSPISPKKQLQTEKKKQENPLATCGTTICLSPTINNVSSLSLNLFLFKTNILLLQCFSKYPEIFPDILYSFCLPVFQKCGFLKNVDSS